MLFGCGAIVGISVWEMNVVKTETTTEFCKITYLCGPVYTCEITNLTVDNLCCFVCALVDLSRNDKRKD